MDELTANIKDKLIEILNLSDVPPDDIDENPQLVGGELGIDSIDVLEMVEEKFRSKGFNDKREVLLNGLKAALCEAVKITS